MGTVWASADHNCLLAIQAYVHGGMIYLEKDDEFSKKVPRSTFESLETMLPTLWDVSFHPLLYSKIQKPLIG